MMPAELYLDIISDLDEIANLANILNVSQDDAKTIIDKQEYSLKDLNQIINN